MATRDEALAALLSLNPAPVFLDAYRGKSLPEGLSIYFGPPEEFFSDEESQLLYTNGVLIPILDDGNFGIATFLDPNSRVLIQKDVDSAFEGASRFENWQQYLGSLVIRMAGSVDDDVRLRVMSDLVGYRYLDETMGLLDSIGDLPYEDYMLQRERFIASLHA